VCARRAKQGKVKIVGFDAGPEQVKALQDGTIQALIAQQPGTIGAEGVKQAVAALKGEASEKQIQTGFTILTKETSSRPRVRGSGRALQGGLLAQGFRDISDAGRAGVRRLPGRSVDAAFQRI
jgi:ABC-type sugar transport system substrate-binding protein